MYITITFNTEKHRVLPSYLQHYYTTLLNTKRLLLYTLMHYLNITCHTTYMHVINIQ